MRERVETLGGTLQAGPRHDAGWTVVATVSIHSGQLA
jgi:signal transduction histidine kinase